MKNDGKKLEALVALIEELHLPDGFKVKTNEKIFNEDGIQTAEFDVEIRGKVGTTEMAWLIECRDRPSFGSAPTSWIEQLVGRRERFRFNKVTAVSTTGFTDDAEKFAGDKGIELRTVTSLSPESFSEWLLLEFITQRLRKTHLLDAKIILAQNVSVSRQKAVDKAISGANSNDALLRKITTNEKVSLANIFHGVVDEKNLFKEVSPNSPPKKVQLGVKYVNDNDHFVIDTNRGAVRIDSILFFGELSIEENLIPLDFSAEYKSVGSDKSISQTASYKMQPFEGREFALELHKLSETGETHILLRCLGDKSQSTE